MYALPDSNNEDCSNYNFFASQIRMRAEMSFGIMANKWSILQRSLLNNMATDKIIVLAIARYHNYIIIRRILQNDWNPLTAYPNLVEAALLEDPNDYPDLENLVQVIGMDGTSHTREQMKQIIKDLGVKRPMRNAIR
jgi:hypothetical protein